MDINWLCNVIVWSAFHSRAPENVYAAQEAGEGAEGGERGFKTLIIFTSK